MSSNGLRLGEELISPLHALYDGLSVEGKARPAERSQTHPVWVVTRYEDAKVILSHAGVRRDGQGALDLYAKRSKDVPRDVGASLGKHMLNSDQPDHGRMRTLVRSAFTTGHVERLRPYVENITEVMLDDMARRSKADLMEDFAVPLTIAVICELLGVPESEREHVRMSWRQQAEVLDPDTAEELANSQARYLNELLDTKLKEPKDDVFSGLAKAAADGHLNETELVSMAHLLLMSGFETTMNMIGNAMVTLLINPDQLTQLRKDPSLMPTAIEELVRYDSPVQASMLRYTVEDIELKDVTIPAGEYVLVSNRLANHDPDRFESPGTLDLNRKADGHLGYGYGAHYCIGAQLARLESGIAIKRLIERFPRLELAVKPEQLQWLPITFLRALIEVPVWLEGQPADQRHEGED